jgi:lysyl-tRNA synthetase class 1
LRQVLRRYDGIMDVMLPTLREERRRTYSPVLPISAVTGKVLQVPVEVLDPEAGTIRFTDPDSGETCEQSILGGGAKLQWKVDWAMRWVALGVDLRDGRQGPDRQRRPELQDRPRARRPPARRLQLRAVPR